MNDSDLSEQKKVIPAAASELNNLIQIISGTVGMLENIWEGKPGSEKYFEMLRASVDRAANVTSQLVKYVGGTDQKILLHPGLAGSTNGKPVPRPVPEKQRCILVVDDEPMALALAKHVLSQAGFEAVTAQSGFECLNHVRSRRGGFDLILLDLSMPVMDGEETFNQLREMDPNALVLLNTGFIEKHRLERMMAAGLAGFLRRPYRPDEVIEQIETVLASVKSSQADASLDTVGALR